MLEATPSYIKQLLQPNGNKKQGRRIWSIDLETVWLPLFHATNVMGDTTIPSEALGCPIRLSMDKDGAVKFSLSGRPVTRVAKEISQTVTLVRENMVANLQAFTHEVAESRAAAFKASIATALKAGQPFAIKDKSDLAKAVKAQVEQALRDTEPQPTEPQPAEPQPTEPKKVAVTA